MKTRWRMACLVRVGYFLDHGFGWGLEFALAGSFHVVAFAVIWLAIPSIQPLKSDSDQTITPVRVKADGLQ